MASDSRPLDTFLGSPNDNKWHRFWKRAFWLGAFLALIPTQAFMLICDEIWRGPAVLQARAQLCGQLLERMNFIGLSVPIGILMLVISSIAWTVTKFDKKEFPDSVR